MVDELDMNFFVLDGEEVMKVLWAGATNADIDAVVRVARRKVRLVLIVSRFSAFERKILHRHTCMHNFFMREQKASAKKKFRDVVR